MSDDMVTIELTRSEYDLLLLTLGYAAGSAMKEHEQGIARMSLIVANAVNRNNPNWTPYAIPPDPTAQ